MRRSYLWFTIAFVMMVAISPAPGVMRHTQVAQAQSSGPQVVNITNVPNLSDVKYPDVLGVGNRAYIAVGTDKTKRKAVHVYTDQPYTTFSDRVTMGEAPGKADYSISIMARGPDGTLYQMWTSQENRNFKIRRLDPNTTSWTSERTLTRGSVFRAHPDMAVTSDGRVFVTWWEDGVFRYATSDNRGDSWSSSARISNDSAVGRAVLAADYQGSMWVAYGTTGDASTAGRIVVGQFVKGGSSFSLREVVPDKSSSNYFNDPTITVYPNNVPVVAWRDVNGGIYYAERRSSDGAWIRSRLVGGKASAYGMVAIVSDSEGNLHLGWAGDTSGRMEFWYAFKPFGLAWQGPKQLTSDSDLDANVSISQTLTDAAYGHMVGERFTGSGLKTRYAALKNVVGCAIKSVTIDNGAAYSADTDLQVRIEPESTCTPTQMQISLNVPPSESTPRVAYNANPTISIPTQYAQQCVQTVYVVLYKDSSAPYNSGAIKSDTIVYDAPGDVDANVSVYNPNLRSQDMNSTPFQNVTDAPGSTRASDGDPAWTGIFQYHISVYDAGECSKLTKFVVNNTTTNMPSGFFNGALGLPYPTSTAPGAKPFDVVVYDGINNSKSYPVTINFDPIDDPSNVDQSGATIADENGRPVLNQGSVAGDANTKSIIRKLSFSGVNVSDNLYRKDTSLYAAGTQFWGVWVANSAPNQTNADPAQTLAWTPVQVAQPATDFSISWNLFNGRAAALSGQQGSYTVFVRFLDGAGNPTNKIISTTLQLDAGYSVPTLFLPLAQR